MHRRSGVLVALMALATTLAGCSDSATGVEVADLAGTYVATKLEFVSIASSSDTVDLVQAGYSYDMTISASGNYTVVTHLTGFPDDTDTGTIVLKGSKITLQSSDPITGTFVLTDVTLTIHVASGAEYDFDNDGSDDPATVTMVFQRT